MHALEVYFIGHLAQNESRRLVDVFGDAVADPNKWKTDSVSYTHLRAHETVLDLVCRLLLEKKKNKRSRKKYRHITRDIQQDVLIVL